MLKKLSKLLGIALTMVLLASLMTVATPAAALSQPTVTFPGAFDDDISALNADYNIIFTVNKQLTAGDEIIVTFPSATTVANVTAVNAAGPGWFNGVYQAAAPPLTNVNWKFSAASKTITLVLEAGNDIGEGAQVRLGILTGIKNPDTVGDYTLTVATSEEPTPVTSTTYSIKAPYVPPLAGITEVYNSANVLMSSYQTAAGIQQAIDAAPLGSTVKVGPGTYDAKVIHVNNAGINIIASGTPEETIVIADWHFYLEGKDAFQNTVDTVLDGFTLRPRAAGGKTITANTTANNTVIKNCVFTKAVVKPNTQVGGTLVTVGAGPVLPTNNDHAVSFINCSFDTTDGAVADKAIQIMDGPVTIDNCSFTIDASATPINDVAIDVTATNNVTNKVYLKNSTITGSSGVGYKVSATGNPTSSTLTGNTFTSLSTAISINSAAAKFSIKENTVTECTNVPGWGVGKALPAIELANNAAVAVAVEKNIIKDNKGHSLVFAQGNANADQVSFTGNQLTGNAYGVINKNFAKTIIAELNYWGDASGPTASANPGGAGDPVVDTDYIKYGKIDYTPWINTSASTVSAGNNVVGNGVIDKSTSAGVAYSSTAACAGITLMKYADNPAPVELSSPALDGGYYDVYSPNAVVAGGTVTLRFYNDNISGDTKAYYYSTLKKAWTQCNYQAVAGNDAYVYVTIGGVPVGADPTIPALSELNETIFALVDEKTIPDAPAINTPTIGEANVSIEPMFTWAAVPGAVRYEISVADDPSFTFLTLSHNVEGITFYKADADNEEALSYDTTYYWRVRAVLEDSYAATTPATPYEVGIFTTMAEPEEVVPGADQPTITVEPTKPEVNVEIPPTKITVEPAGAAIPTYILWIIVVVGAVLIIALIVLIVRTRRVA
jgi:hypothetical protein